MTTNDYDARLARLNAATRGDTVTVPDGWTAPDDAPAGCEVDLLAPGTVLVNDGTGDDLPWKGRTYFFSRHLAVLGLDVDAADAADEDQDEQVVVSDAVPDGEALAGDFSDEAWGSDPPAGDEDDEDGPTPIGSVTVRVIPDTDGFVEAVAKVAGEAADAVDAAGFHLDEYQRERVAALEQALRILEARRAPKGSEPGSFAAMFGKRAEVPMVGVRDVVYVAAFIAEAETGAVGEVKA